MEYNLKGISDPLKKEDGLDDEPKKNSREDRRKAKELEEARKAGTAPAAVDEEGRDINPHIPQYISATPWYFGATGPTLRHQRPQPEKQKQFNDIDDWYYRGVDTSKVVTKFRKGACENCGAVTHKRKECMERPRKVGAQYTNTNIASDEYVQPELSMDYDGKRDRWAGYDPSEHRAIVEEYQKIEAAKRQMRAEKLNAEEDDEQDIDEDEDKYVDEVDMPGTKVDSKQRITVRNLRIREDTAKYLRNLDPNSAYYDPKTRSMRDNPYVGKGEEVDYKGENFVRLSGDTQVHANAQLFAWDAHKKGVDVHLLAEPTKLELLKQEYDKKRDELKNEVRDNVINRYGGEEHLQVPDPSLLLAQTENYIEYSRCGKIIKGQERQVIRSKYEEDVFPNNHTSVWGSYWHAGKWGFKCCHSYIKNSYCTGESGILATDAAQSFVSEIVPSTSREDVPIHQPLHEQEPNEDNTKQSKKNNKRKNIDKYVKNSDNSESDNNKHDGEDSNDSSDSSSDSSAAIDIRSKTERKATNSKKNKRKKRKEKMKNRKKSKGNADTLKRALEKEEENQKNADRLLQMDEKKRPYNSMYQVKEPTANEMEAFQMKRRRDEDPMAQFEL